MKNLIFNIIFLRTLFFKRIKNESCKNNLIAQRQKLSWFPPSPPVGPPLQKQLTSNLVKTKDNVISKLTEKLTLWAR